MSQPTRQLVFSVALCVVSNFASAQATYKCGNSYSETPCANAVIVESRDDRTREQKLQAEASTKTNEKMVKKFASERTKREKKEAAANRKAAEIHAAKVEAQKRRTGVVLIQPYPSQATPAAKNKMPKRQKALKAPKLPKASKPPKVRKST
jgi:hypothetical protein